MEGAWSAILQSFFTEENLAFQGLSYYREMLK